MEIPPLISVVMPAYNAAETIIESINSLLSQDYLNWELIVIDDGSTDDTYHKASSIKDSRIRIYQEFNKGVAATRNQGIQIAKGKYVAFLDADDLWNMEKLKNQVSFFESKEEKLGLIHSYYVEFDDLSEYRPKPLKHLSGLKLEGNIYEDLIVHNFIATLTVMVKKDVLNEVGGFDVTLSGPEDWDLWIRIARKYKVGYIDKSLARYRLNPSGLSKNVYKFEDQLWEVMEKHLLTSNLPEHKIKLGLWLYYRHVSHAYARVYQFDKAFNRLYKAIQVRPFLFRNFHSISYLFFVIIKKYLKRERIANNQ